MYPPKKGEIYTLFDIIYLGSLGITLCLKIKVAYPVILILYEPSLKAETSYTPIKQGRHGVYKTRTL